MKKAFNTKTYAVIVFFLVGALLATITVTAYKSRYTAFNPEKTAIAFVQNIVETGDGYNAYKNALLSKNYKYGDYIREYYIYPVIYRESSYTPGDNRDNLKGYNDDSFKSEKTLNDDGSLSGKVIEAMYPYYESLIEELGGWDNYDTFFTKYFEELCRVREEVFGDKYMTDEIMFTALEANVVTYGESLKGTEDEFDSNTGVQTGVKSIGIYEKAFGEGYKFTYEIASSFGFESIEGYISEINKEALDSYKISGDDINDIKVCTVLVKVNGKALATQEVTLVQIGSSWYVDNTNIDTSELYKTVR